MSFSRPSKNFRLYKIFRLKYRWESSETNSEVPLVYARILVGNGPIGAQWNGDGPMGISIGNCEFFSTMIVISWILVSWIESNIHKNILYAVLRIPNIRCRLIKCWFTIRNCLFLEIFIFVRRFLYEMWLGFNYSARCR